MEDRELLELAAKAAGYSLRDGTGLDEGGLIANGGQHDFLWNPLTDDGDALRLAVKLGMTLWLYLQEINAHAETRKDSLTARILVKGDPMAATRRAIVRAAAEIGRAMP